MKKLTLRTEHLGELTVEQLRQVAGGVPQANTVSDGSCGCTIPLGAILPNGGCDVSDQSCGCFCPQTQTLA